MKRLGSIIITIVGIFLGILAILFTVGPVEAVKNLGSWTNILLPPIIVILFLLFCYYAIKYQSLLKKPIIQHKFIKYESSELKNEIENYLPKIKSLNIFAYSSETLFDFLTWEEIRKHNIDVKILVRNEVEEVLDQIYYNLGINDIAWEKSIIAVIRGREHNPRKANIITRFYSGPPLFKGLFVNLQDNTRIVYLGVYRWVDEPHLVKEEKSQYVGADCRLLKLEGKGGIEEEFINQLESRFQSYWKKHSISLKAMEEAESQIPNELKAVFFDFDGVVVNSMPIYEKAWTEGAKGVGICIDPLIIYLREGERSRDTARYILNVAGKDPNDDSLISSILSVKDRYLDANYTPAFFEGIKDCIRALRKSGLKTVLVTGASGKNRRKFIDDTCEGLFNDIVCGDDVTSGKPSPAPYYLALQKAGEEPKNCVAIENSPFGAKSAISARISCIGLNISRKLDDSLLMSEGCIAVMKSARMLENYIVHNGFLIDSLRMCLTKIYDLSHGLTNSLS
jgi:beta-phosphoglucomutase-like phosphatase (HAD superfamily)